MFIKHTRVDKESFQLLHPEHVLLSHSRQLNSNLLAIFFSKFMQNVFLKRAFEKLICEFVCHAGLLQLRWKSVNFRQHYFISPHQHILHHTRKSLCNLPWCSVQQRVAVTPSGRNCVSWVCGGLHKLERYRTRFQSFHDMKRNGAHFSTANSSHGGLLVCKHLQTSYQVVLKLRKKTKTKANANRKPAVEISPHSF